MGDGSHVVQETWRGSEKQRAAPHGDGEGFALWHRSTVRRNEGGGGMVGCVAQQWWGRWWLAVDRRVTAQVNWWMGASHKAYSQKTSPCILPHSS